MWIAKNLVLNLVNRSLQNGERGTAGASRDELFTSEHSHTIFGDGKM